MPGCSSITSAQSVCFDILKLGLLMGVMFGHAVALSGLPTISNLDFGSTSGVLVGAIRTISGFGREAAFLFIFLSGFFTAPVFFGESDKVFGLRSAVARRIARLYPVLLLSLIVTALLDYLGVFVLNWTVYESNGLMYRVREHWGLEIFLLNLLSLEPTAALTFGSNGPLWTLGYLIQFYLLASLWVKCLGRNPWALSVASVVTAVPMVAAVGWEPVALFGVWLLGTFLRLRREPLFPSVASGLLLAVLAVGVLIAKFSPSWGSILFTPLVGVMTIILIARVETINQNCFVGAGMWLAPLGFAAYLAHMPAFFFLKGFYQFWSDGREFEILGAVWFMLFGCVVAFSIAWCFENLLRKI